ncbi:flagellar basal body rod protein FlgB [Microbulbifer rhizosphaerae]|uniref:Flagellar basal-body rod protein FlgB n=1 Tax=Microbulbifer rhizosphaerae TaxID=1562603 RepID=A0A7W4WGX3_9GAMM|nr:hypothetical protein [Microbulbifer rhizosphaerae]MBB3063488.1 flagellar basal-body rod protein FlgB [Microbulbifer rhizosphaerae]
MIEILGSLTNDLLGKALDRASVENRLIATNVANIDTEGYQPVTTKFGEIYEQLVSAISSENYARLNELEQKWSPADDINFHPSKDKVRLEEEMVKLAKNTLHFQSLLTAKSQLSGIVKVAVKEGRE